MPHCIIEYSDNITEPASWDSVFRGIHNAIVNTGEWYETDIKSRAIKYEHYYIGDGGPDQSFVTLTIQILEGRDDVLKARISEDALTVLVSCFSSNLKQLKYSLTVQVVDIHRPSYCRKVFYEHA